MPRWVININLDKFDLSDLLREGEFNLSKPATEDHPEMIVCVKLHLDDSIFSIKR